MGIFRLMLPKAGVGVCDVNLLAGIPDGVDNYVTILRVHDVCKFWQSL